MYLLHWLCYVIVTEKNASVKGNRVRLFRMNIPNITS